MKCYPSCVGLNFFVRYCLNSLQSVIGLRVSSHCNHVRVGPSIQMAAIRTLSASLIPLMVKYCSTMKIHHDRLPSWNISNSTLLRWRHNYIHEDIIKYQIIIHLNHNYIHDETITIIFIDFKLYIFHIH